MTYSTEYDMEYNQTIIWHEPLHVIFCLDASGSMGGNPWDNIKKGAIKLLMKIKNTHK